MDNIDLLDCDYMIDIACLQKEWKLLSKDGIKDWFIKHDYLSLADLARITGIQRRAVQRYRTRFGLTKPNNQVIPSYSAPRRTTIEAPDNWREINWDVEMYNAGYSIPQIAIATGCRNCNAYNRLKAKGVRFRSVREVSRSKNPCCTREWLLTHYRHKKWSTTKCAKAAGVSPFTIEAWLIQHNIRILSPHESRQRTIVAAANCKSA